MVAGGNGLDKRNPEEHSSNNSLILRSRASRIRSCSVEAQFIVQTGSSMFYSFFKPMVLLVSYCERPVTNVAATPKRPVPLLVSVLFCLLIFSTQSVQSTCF